MFVLSSLFHQRNVVRLAVQRDNPALGQSHIVCCLCLKECAFRKTISLQSSLKGHCLHVKTLLGSKASADLCFRLYATLTAFTNNTMLSEAACI